MTVWAGPVPVAPDNVPPHGTLPFTDSLSCPFGPSAGSAATKASDLDQVPSP